VIPIALADAIPFGAEFRGQAGRATLFLAIRLIIRQAISLAPD